VIETAAFLEVFSKWRTNVGDRLAREDPQILARIVELSSTREGISQRALQQDLKINQSRLSKLTKKLAACKWVVLRKSSSDRRVLLMTATDLAKAKVDWLRKELSAVIELRKCRVDFMPIDEPELATVAAPPSPPRPKRKKKPTTSKVTITEPTMTEPAKTELTRDELTISAELIVEFIRKNVPPGSWRRFFNELSAGSSTQAVFTRAWPKPGESRLLDESVIEECAPPMMPEDPQEHLTACIAWFARWGQRVIPKTVWQQAMQEAKKTLLPTLDGR
jgi:DNA-binding MarR family transcriptional regulator